MRTTKRFTPDVLDRFRRQRRGIGTYNDYVPWHRVSRGDPSSYGRSHLLMWRGRQRELLSDLELVGFCFSSMVVGPTDDIREQFPLSLDPVPHELSAYDVRYAAQTYEGTLAIANKLGIKHPRTHGNGRSEAWVMTTDLLLTIYGTSKSETEFIAVAIKSSDDISHRRTRELLQIEQAYWSARGVRWLLITPDLYDRRVALTLRNTLPWGLGEAVEASQISVAAAMILEGGTKSFTQILSQLVSSQECTIDQGQRAIWQAIWSGVVPVDLRRGWRPHLTLDVISKAAFDELNPILSMRSVL